MNYKINKIFIAIIMVFSMLLPMLSYADDKTTIIEEKNKILTYEEAVKLAVKESNEIKNLKLEKESKAIKIDDTLDNFGDSLYDPEVLALMKIQKSDEITTNKAEKAESLANQYLKITIKGLFSKIDLDGQNINLKKEQLKNSIKKRNTLSLKVDYGMESKTNLKTKDIEISQEKKELEKLDKDMNDNYVNLNKLLGFNLFDRYEIEKLVFEYVPIKDTQEDIEFKMMRTVNGDLSLWGIKQQLEIQSLDIDFYALNYIDGLPSKLQSSTTPYKALELDVQIASNDIEKAKLDLKNSVISKYNTIKAYELDHENILLKLQELQEKKRVLEVLIKAGVSTSQDYEDLLLGIKQAKIGLEALETRHTLLVETYNNPVLAGGGSN